MKPASTNIDPSRELKLHVNQAEKERLRNMGVPLLDYDGLAYIDFESFEDMNNVRSSFSSLSSCPTYNPEMGLGLY